MFGFNSFSPKAVLASKLAAKLDTYFLVDQKAITLSLQNEKKISLQNTQIKPIRLASSKRETGDLVLVGSVQSIDFFWKWGGDEKTSFVREVELVITGVSIDVIVSPASSSTGPSETICTEEDVFPERFQEQQSSQNSTIQEYVQQIMDHLTLTIRDVEIIVDRSLVISASNWTLKTLAKDGSRLHQQLTAGSIGVDVLMDSSGETLPLIEPTGYTVAVERTSGKRFRNFGRGLHVAGTATECISIHLGENQLSSLSSLSKRVRQALASSVEDFPISGFSSPEKTESPDGDDEAWERDDVTSFCLPFPRIIVFLPRSSSISIPNCEANLNFSGSKCILSGGTEPICVNGESVFRLFDRGWELDTVEKQFRLVPLSEQSFVESISEEYALDTSVEVKWCQIKMSTFLQALSDLAVAEQAILGTTSSHFQYKKEGMSSPSTDTHWSITLSSKTSFVVEGQDKKWLKGTILPLSLLLSERGIQKLMCEGIRIDSSFDLTASAPSFLLEDSAVSFRGNISAKCLSTANLQDLYGWVLGLVPGEIWGSQPKSSMTLTSVSVPGASFGISSKNAFLKISKILYRGSSLGCIGVQIQYDGCITSFSGFGVSFDDDIVHITIEKIQEAKIPNSIRLAQPVDNVTLDFSQKSLMISANLVMVELLYPTFDPFDTVHSKTDTEVDGDFLLPFELSVLIGEIVVSDSSVKNSETSLIGLEANVLPGKNSSGTRSLHKVKLRSVEMRNALAGANDSTVSFSIEGMDVNCLHDLQAEVASANVSAGFSQEAWKSMFHSNPVKSISILLPNAVVKRFQARISYSGKIFSSEGVVTFKEFIGNKDTTYEDIERHITKCVLGQTTNFLGKAQLMGVSITEGLGSYAGRAVVSRSVRGGLLGASGGSVIGVIAVDGIKSSVSTGKQVRGATEHDRYRFGDFSRGLMSSARSLTKSGAESRRGSSEDYHFGDFSTGASKSARTYVGENKSRLAGASGSGTGALLGAAVAGPIGMVAGALVGGMAGSRAFSDTEMQSHDPFQDNQASIRAFSTDQPGDNLIDFQDNGQNRSRGGEQACSASETVGQQAPNSNQLLFAYQDGFESPPPPQAGSRKSVNTGTNNSSGRLSDPTQPQHQGYRLGDVTRSIIAKGKAKSGRSEKSGYKFGYVRGRQKVILFYNFESVLTLEHEEISRVVYSGSNCDNQFDMH